MNYGDVMNSISNVNVVCSAGVCSGCGACVVACPQSCISMEKGHFNRPIIEEECCRKCKLCLKVCPSFEYLNDTDSILKNDSSNCLGSISHCVICHATDRVIRLKSASGGFITTMANYLLEKKFVDGVICVKQDNENPFMNKVFIAKNKQEVIGAAASRYSPASSCLPLKNLLMEQGRYAFVGKPCDIQGLKKLQSEFPILKKNIYLIMGLFCHHTPSRVAFDHILSSHGVNQKEVSSVIFRGDGWPGNFELISNGEVKLSMPYFQAWTKYFSNLDYVPTRCLLCMDATAEEADFSVGDPWGEEFKQDKIGQSLVIVRNTLASDLYSVLIDEKYIVGNNVTVQDVKRYQTNLLAKKENSILWYKAFINLQQGLICGTAFSLIDKQTSFRQKLSVLKKMAILYRKVGEA